MLRARAISDISQRSAKWFRAVSSAGEHYVDIVGVTGSIPVPPTTIKLLKSLSFSISGVDANCPEFFDLGYLGENGSRLTLLLSRMTLQASLARALPDS